MACPHFRPTEPRLLDQTPRHSMLPLGDVWAGTCHSSADPVTPGDSELVPLCNVGYARGTCPRLAGDTGPDSIRFAISTDQDGVIGVAYVEERDHHPLAHGILSFDRATLSPADPTPGENLRVQARAYVSSYLRRKLEAGVR